MKSTQKTRHALVTSVVCMVLCCAMLLGTTFAWFTDSVTNEGNVITAGNLSIDAVAYDVDMENTSSTSYQIDEVNGGNKFYFEDSGQDLKTEDCPAIISETSWEPGKSNAKLLTVTNKGDLAAKIKLQFEVEDGGLQSALWFDFVQVKDGSVAGSFTRRPMSEINTVAQNLEIPLGAGKSVSFILIYGMNESADNDYQGKSFSADVTILATQDTVEADGFGNTDYDADATYTWSGGSDEEGLAENTDTDSKAVTIETAEQLAAFADAVNEGNDYSGYTVTLTRNMDLGGGNWVPIGKDGKMFRGTFDGGNHVIVGLSAVNALSYGNGFFGNLAGATVKNVTFDGAFVSMYDKTSSLISGNVYGIVSGYAYGNVTFENVHVKNSVVRGYGKVGGILGMAAEPGDTVTALKNCSVENTTIVAVYNAGGLIGLTQNIVDMEGSDTVNVVGKLVDSSDTYVDLNTTAKKYVNNNSTEEQVQVTGKYWKYRYYDINYYYAAWGDYYTDYYYTGDASTDWRLTEIGVNDYVADGLCHNK